MNILQMAINLNFTIMPIAYWKVMDGQSMRKAKNEALEQQ